MASDDNHLKAWRKHRKLTQQQLADAVDPPTTKSVIQALESGQRGLSDKWLRRLAPALRTRPGFLLDHDPAELSSDQLDLIDYYEAVPADRKAEAVEMMAVMAKRRA